MRPRRKCHLLPRRSTRSGVVRTGYRKVSGEPVDSAVRAKLCCLSHKIRTGFDDEEAGFVASKDKT
jgi:hypothetical protein